MKRWLPVLLLSILLAAVGLVLTPRGRAIGEALALLGHVWSVGAAPQQGAGPRVWSYPGPGSAPRVADVYCDPATAPGARLILVHGLIDTGKDDARLRTLGRALARHRLMVVVPDFPGLKALRVGREDIAEVQAAIAAAVGLNGCPEDPGPPRRLPTGVVGFSYSAGPALIALAGEHAAPADFAVLFGGYDDLADVILFLTTGVHRDRGADLEGEMVPEGRWVLLAANADAIADRQDAARLRAIGELRRRRPDAPIDTLADGIGPAARSLLDLVRNDDPARFPALLERLDPGVRSLMEDLSPAHALRGPLRAGVVLIHGRGDTVIPYTQSLKLARHLECPGGPRVILLGGFRHARPQGAAAGWRTAVKNPGDSLQLLGILADLLGRRVDPA